MAAISRVRVLARSLTKGRSLMSQVIPSINGCKFYCSDKPISRYPVPDVENLAPDMQERIAEVAEKVSGPV